MKRGQVIRCKKQADEMPGEIPGDVVITIDERPHTKFKRDGFHLRMKKRISLLQALGGFEFEVTHLDNRILHVKSEKGVIYKPGDVKAVLEEGMPIYKDPFKFGNLYIEFVVEFPETVSPELIQALKRISGAPSRLILPQGAQEVKLVSFNEESEMKKFQQFEKNAQPDSCEEDPSEERGGCKTQ
eukprot:CAMPEP_0184482816 /NCGR_PEP_ID=MMETSP0113_2-20130426/4407_1 /TAXON_ID=91329 /ORGANISM="Norrisiella sphaerica, Strain BC52" /LENGTH=184 /DNA_ID=CAMNT_0026862805 /DNA_START=762 /DNA_END=1316 /DNA_ORIENTATION=+